MSKKSKSIVEEFPMTIVLTIGGAFLFNKLFNGFWLTILGLVLGLVAGLIIDGQQL